MLSLGSKKLRGRVEEIVSRPDAARYIGWRLFVGGEDYSRRLKGGGYTTEDGPALVLDADVSGVVSEALEGEEVILEWMVEGAPVAAFTGTLTDAVYDASTGLSTLKGVSSGDALERTELGIRIEYGGVEPSTAVNDALTRVGGYKGGLIEVQTIETPKFTRQGADAYSATDFAAEILQAVQEENPRLAIYDRANGGARSLIEPNLADMPSAVWTFAVDRDIKRSDFSGGREDDLYREVVVRRAVSAPSVGSDPWVVLGRVTVEGSKAQAGTIERIDVSDNDTEAAFRKAHEAATARAYRIGRISFKAPVHPLLERGDVVAITNPGTDEYGPYVERWLCILDRAHCEEVRTKRAHYEGEARVVETVRPKRIPSAVGGLTPGVVPKSMWSVA